MSAMGIHTGSPSEAIPELHIFIHPEIKYQVTVVWIHHGLLPMLPALHPFCASLLQGSEVPAGREEAVNRLFPRKSLFLTLKARWGGMQEGTQVWPK